MKKAVCMLLAATLLLGLLAGCGPKQPARQDPAQNPVKDPSQNNGPQEPGVPQDPIRGFERDGDTLTLTRGDITVTVDAVTGFLTSVSSGYDSLQTGGVLVDGGFNGQSLLNQLGYSDLSGNSTWELPLLYPKMKDLPPYTVDSAVAGDDGFTVTMTCGEIGLLYRYGFLESGVSLSVELSTTSAAPVPVNGVGFVVRGIDGFQLENATFEFPGGTPAGRQKFSSRTKYKALASDYACSAVQLADGVKTSNILFVNEVEKWFAGCWFDNDGKLCTGFLSATEGFLEPGKP